MKVKVDMDHLIQKEIEANEARNRYYSLSKKLFKKRGYGVNLDHPRTEAERQIVYAYYSDERESATHWDLCRLLGLDREAQKRLTTAARCLTRWYQKTEWMKCPPEDLIEKLGAYIIG